MSEELVTALMTSGSCVLWALHDMVLVPRWKKQHRG